MVNYKLYMIIPIVILLISIVYVGAVIYTGGLELDIDLKGGTEISIETSAPVDSKNIESALSDYSVHVRVARGLSGNTVFISFDRSIDQDEIIDKLNEAGYDFDDYSSQTIDPTLGASFFYQAQLVLFIAFIFMAITIFILFKNPLPSFYMVLVAAADIIETLVLTQILGIKLSFATFAALLLLIGYSVDTDVLLTTRVLKNREGTLKERLRGAMKTGLTMNVTTITALMALFLVTGSNVLTQIASVLVIGLLLDIINTWLLNAPLLRWYTEKKERVESK